MRNIEMNLYFIVLLALLPLAAADLTVDVKPCSLPMEPNTTTGSIVITNSTAKVNETCTITIPNIKKSEQISLYLHQLKSPSPNLFYVYDGVYDPTLNDTNLLYNSTGKTGPVWMVVFSNVSTIVFDRTGNDVENITIDFDSEECVQTVSSGVISPPQFLPDTADLSCSYNLNQTLESPYVGVLSFLTFDISDGSITIDNGTEYRGSTLPRDTFLSKPDVKVDLSLKKSNKSQTFSGLLSQVVKDCSENVTLNTTQDYTIQIPSQHYLVSECRLIFTSQNNKQLKVELHTVKLLGADHLNLADGDSQGDRDLVGGDYGLAETSTGNIFLTSGSSMWMRLVVDTLPGKREVILRFSESDGDGRYYDQGKLTLGASKKHMLKAGSSDYYYQLVTSTQVEVNLNQTKLIKGSIEFYDGLQTTSKLITSFGADTTFYPVTSSKGELLIVARNFTTEQVPATFHNVDGSCNVDTSERTGSYSLMKLTKDEEKCMWTISPQSGGEVIALQLLMINLRVNDTLTVSSIVTASTPQILAQITGPKMTSVIPQINIPSDQRTQITFSTTNNCNGSTCTNPTVMAGYSTTEACNGPLSPPSGIVTSPNWPNIYPLNAECIWSDVENATTSKNKLLHMSFSKFNLPNNHSLTLTSSVGKAQKQKVFMGSQVPDDIIVQGDNYTLTFSSVEKKPVLQTSVGEGFVLNYNYLECGGSITTAKGIIMSPDYPKPNNKSQICAWTIHIPDTTDNKTANILQFDLILDNKNKSVKSLLEIHDGGSINDPVMILSVNATLNKTRLMSRTNKLFILYDNTASGTPGLTFHMNYSTHDCKILCDNGVCLHDDWRCNKINECGDNTDEVDCKGPGPTPAPKPTPAPSKGGSNSGVSSYWVPLCLLFGIVMGIVGVIFLPRIYRRLRSHNYNTLHEVNNPAA